MPALIMNMQRWCAVGVLTASLALLVAQEAGDGSIARANDLAAKGDRGGAIKLLEERIRANPDDQLARQTLLGLRIGETEAEVRRLLAEQAKSSPGRLGDPDYEEARKRSATAVQRRLDVAEYYVRQHRYADAVAAINAILRDFPHDPAAMTLKLQVLNALADEERVALVKEKAAARENAINDAIDAAIMPGELPRTKRPIIIFDEDVDAAERAELRKRMQARVDLIFDGISKFKKADGSEETAKPASVRELLQTLFAISGINYVLLDSSIGSETVTLHLVQEPVENCLTVLSKLVKVRYNYSGGTVFVSSSDSEVLVTEIIHLQAGLTDVQATPELGDFGGGGGGSSRSSRGGGGSGGYGGSSNSRSGNNSNNGMNNQGLNQIGGNRGGAGGTGGTGATGGKGGTSGAAGGKGGGGSGEQNSDLERMLEKVPDLVTDWPSDGKIFLDRKSNTVYVRSTPASITELRRLIKSLDYNNVQVLIEARFVEVADTATSDLGVNWEMGATSAALSVSGVTTGFNTPVTASAPQGVGGATFGAPSSATGGNGFFAQVLSLPSTSFGIKTQIAALEQKGLADTLSSPQILTLNNAQGIIQFEKEISYIGSYENIGGGASYGNNNQQQQPGQSYYPPVYSNTAQIPVYEKDSEGIRLSIRPSVARNSDIVTLVITPTVREMVRAPQRESFSNSTGDGSSGSISNPIDRPPEFDTRSLATILHIKNGGTVALGGLSREKEQKDRAGVPVLSRVPFLGALFRKDSRLSSRSNLMIFVTAYIIDPSGAKQGDEIERLRDTARIILPDEVAASERNARAKDAEEERKGSEKAKEEDRTEIWRRDRRR